jgi:hypothetical protein
VLAVTSESTLTFQCAFLVTLEAPQEFVASRRNERLLDPSESNCSSVDCFVLYNILYCFSEF